jgi:hypothetical protein
MTPIIANYLDRRIYKAITGYTPDHAQSLVGILAYVDSQEKMLLTHEELVGGLKRLIEAGLVTEATNHAFFESVRTDAARAFSGISPDVFESACRDYHNWFASQLQQDDDGAAFTRQKLVIRWKLNGDTYPTDNDEDATETFATAIESAIAESGLGEINGFEHGAGLIDILIFGRETDDDVDDIYSLIADTFKSYGCPPGSCIIKCYHDPRREVVCDEIL